MQRFRIYQELNNLRLRTPPKWQEKSLTLEQRGRNRRITGKKTNVTFKKMRTALQLPATVKFNLEDSKRTKLDGNKTAKILAKKDHFGADWHGFSPEKQNDIVSRLLDEASESQLIDWLKKSDRHRRRQGGTDCRRPFYPKAMAVSANRR